MVRYHLLFLLLVPAVCYSQRITNLRAKVVKETVEISYDLIDAASDQTFDVLLYSSVNKFVQPLERVSGDLGKNIKPGSNKLIIWTPESELIKFRGEVVFELQVKVFTPFVTFISPTSEEILKRGSTHLVEWKGANANSKLMLDLYQEEVKLTSIESSENIGKLKWSIPASVKPGGGYKILIYEEGKSDNRAFSNPFIIKRKLPTGLKLSISVLGAGILGTIIAAISNGNSSGGDGKIPPPIDPN